MSPRQAIEMDDELSGDGLVLNYIDGEWREGSEGQRATDIDPSCGDPLLEVTVSTARDCHDALAAAAAAQPGWREPALSIAAGSSSMRRQSCDHGPTGWHEP